MGLKVAHIRAVCLRPHMKPWLGCGVCQLLPFDGMLHRAEFPLAFAVYTQRLFHFELILLNPDGIQLLLRLW
jgi:hypothetical protein